eukprot:355667-Chlamydomonas_euryale.AAC.4
MQASMQSPAPASAEGTSISRRHQHQQKAAATAEGNSKSIRGNQCDAFAGLGRSHAMAPPLAATTGTPHAHLCQDHLYARGASKHAHRRSVAVEVAAGKALRECGRTSVRVWAVAMATATSERSRAVARCRRAQEQVIARAVGSCGRLIRQELGLKDAMFRQSIEAYVGVTVRDSCAH